MSYQSIYKALVKEASIRKEAGPAGFAAVAARNLGSLKKSPKRSIYEAANPSYLKDHRPRGGRVAPRREPGFHDGIGEDVDNAIWKGWKQNGGVGRVN